MELSGLCPSCRPARRSNQCKNRQPNRCCIEFVATIKFMYRAMEILALIARLWPSVVAVVDSTTLSDDMVVFSGTLGEKRT